MLDVSGNGNHLSAWDDNWARYRPQVPLPITPRTGVSNTLSVQNSNAFPAMSAIGTNLTSWSPSEWTIEAAIRPDAVSGFQTIVGRDSYGANAANPAAAALYFSLRPGGILAIAYTDVAGTTWNLESAPNAIVAGQWQSIAATSDGSTLRLYCRNITTNTSAYSLLGTLDISGSTKPALSPGARDGANWDPGVITVGRGLFDGNHTDRFFGHLDDIRLSSAALSPDQFLYVPQPEAPLNLAASPGAGKITLTWAAVQGATNYNLKRSEVSGGPYATIAQETSTTSFIDEAIIAGTNYFYVVTAVRDGVESLPSSEVSAAILTAAQAWRQTHFGTTADAGDAADGEDPDNDGMINLMERALGTDPNVSSASATPQSSTDGGKLTITFTRNSAATDLTLSVMAANSPVGPWSEIARSINGAAFTAIAPGALVSETGTGSVKNVETTDIVLVTDPAHPKRFMRVEVTR